MEFNRKGVQDAIKANVDVPGWLRSSFLNDRKIDEMCERIQPELEQVFQEQLTANQEAFDKLIAKVEQGLETALSTKVQEAIILIQ